MVKGITGRKRGFVMETKVKKRMIREARKVYSKIFPCGLKKSLEECFTITDDTVLLWFNTKDQNTHVVMAEKGEVMEVSN